MNRVIVVTTSSGMIPAIGSSNAALSIAPPTRGSSVGSVATTTSHRAGTTLTAVPPEIAAGLSLGLTVIASRAASIAFTPSAGVLECAALPAKVSRRDRIHARRGGAESRGLAGEGNPPRPHRLVDPQWREAEP